MNNEDRIQPWTKNPHYWQYKGKPILLLGGSKTDHFFLLDDLRTHADEVALAGANFVRNTMSQRQEKELKPYRFRPDGLFDLNYWNPEYWTRFQNMLAWTAEREIFVQIEVWDRFDYSEKYWDHSPWNPVNNINYTYEETGFGQEYPISAWLDKHPFFHSIPGMPMYTPKLDTVRTYQERFVAEMLSYSLEYGHVLYCMNNETNTPAEWGKYWIHFIQKKASEKKVLINTVDMFDDAYLGPQSKHATVVFDDIKNYSFADISQVNSRNYDDGHWETMRWSLEQVNRHPRPCNNTKIYGGGYATFGSRSQKDGVERFWRK